MQPRKQNGGASKGDRIEVGVNSGKLVCPCRQCGTSIAPNMGPEIDERRAKKRLSEERLESSCGRMKHTTLMKATYLRSLDQIKYAMQTFSQVLELSLFN